MSLLREDASLHDPLTASVETETLSRAPSQALPVTLEQFLTEFHDALMADEEALVDWQLTQDGSSFCFRIGLPGLSSSDMEGAPPEPTLGSGEEIQLDTPDLEHLCPITYLAFRKQLGCYSVCAVDRAASKLRLPDAVRDVLIAAADQPHTGSVLYWHLQALFSAKESQILGLRALLEHYQAATQSDSS